MNRKTTAIMIVFTTLISSGVMNVNAMGRKPDNSDKNAGEKKPEPKKLGDTENPNKTGLSSPFTKSDHMGSGETTGMNPSETETKESGTDGSDTNKK